MEFFIISFGIIFALFSTFVLSYVSMTTSIGPWIAPTLALLGHFIFKFTSKQGTASKNKSIASMQALGAVGGILATGVGFALPMLYFLDPVVFKSWIASPCYFCTVMAALCICAGGLGLIIGKQLSSHFIEEKQYPFPVSELTHQAITSQTHPQQAKYMTLGILATLVLCSIRDGIGRFGALIAKTYYIFPSLLGQELPFAIWPSLWSIGYSVGLSITIPLLVGLISKYLVVYPLAQHINYFSFGLVPALPIATFTTGFSSGLVLWELISGLSGYARRGLGQLQKGGGGWVKKLSLPSFSSLKWGIEPAWIGLGIIILFWHFKFSLLSQLLLLVFTALATYFICQISAKIGLLSFGRFSTFVVVPLVLMFDLNSVQKTISCVFFNICAATASDLLFDYKTGILYGIQQKKMYRYQWIGLIATSLGIGICLWLLFTHLPVGTEALFAQRSKAKALLLQSLHFDLSIVGLGCLFGWMLKKIKLNPTMVFGGLLMPNSITCGLLLGSLSTLLFKNKDKVEPICAGILAVEAIWVIISMLAGMM